MAQPQTKKGDFYGLDQSAATAFLDIPDVPEWRRWLLSFVLTVQQKGHKKRRALLVRRRQMLLRASRRRNYVERSKVNSQQPYSSPAHQDPIIPAARLNSVHCSQPKGMHTALGQQGVNPPVLNRPAKSQKPTGLRPWTLQQALQQPNALRSNPHLSHFVIDPVLWLSYANPNSARPPTVRHSKQPIGFPSVHHGLVSVPYSVALKSLEAPDQGAVTVRGSGPPRRYMRCATISPTPPKATPPPSLRRSRRLYPRSITPPESDDTSIAGRASNQQSKLRVAHVETKKGTKRKRSTSHSEPEVEEDRYKEDEYPFDSLVHSIERASRSPVVKQEPRDDDESPEYEPFLSPCTARSKPGPSRRIKSEETERYFKIDPEILPKPLPPTQRVGPPPYSYAIERGTVYRLHAPSGGAIPVIPEANEKDHRLQREDPWQHRELTKEERKLWRVYDQVEIAICEGELDPDAIVDVDICSPPPDVEPSKTESVS